MASLFGTPEECLEMLEELQAMSIHEIICNLNFAGMLEHRQALHSMELFAAKVMAHLVCPALAPAADEALRRRLSNAM